jgi:hypothetical protein
VKKLKLLSSPRTIDWLAERSANYTRARIHSDNAAVGKDMLHDLVEDHRTMKALLEELGYKISTGHVRHRVRFGKNSPLDNLWAPPEEEVTKKRRVR